MRKALPFFFLLSGVLAAGSCIFPGCVLSTETGGRDRPAIAGLKGTKLFAKDIEDYYRLLRLPALAVGVARGDSLIFFKGMGKVTTLPGEANTSLSKAPAAVADAPAAAEAPTPDHIFPIASITKSFTAVALKQMEGEGKLSLQDPLNKYPNEFFTEDRWDPQTTLAHLLSHTSESSPHGTQFVYNGSKFNVLFNAFQAVSKTNVPDDITRPFTEEIRNRILTPLNMDHTLLRYTEKEHGALKQKVVQTYRLDDSSGNFVPAGFNLRNMQAGPGFGMMSSVNDLVRYSAALGRNKLLTAAQYEALTTPFYAGSPYGEGWFTTRFEGTAIHWAYGYGDNDAALLLRVPSSDLTLVILAPCSLPSAATRLGYGNPFNSILVCSFFRNFVQGDPAGSRLPVEEKFAAAATRLFLPASFNTDAAGAQKALMELMKEFPADTIWQTPAAFELVAASQDPQILKFGQKMADRYLRQGKLHPVKAWYAGLICQKNGNPEKGMACFEPLAWGDQYREQPYKFNAMMEVAKRHAFFAPRHAREILQDLVRFKDYINVNDEQYREAKQLLVLKGDDPEK